MTPPLDWCWQATQDQGPQSAASSELPANARFPLGRLELVGEAARQRGPGSAAPPGGQDGVTQSQTSGERSARTTETIAVLGAGGTMSLAMARNIAPGRRVRDLPITPAKLLT